ncbi:MAG: carboxypeptidase-like regulatory domain-containing protein [Flammeovirgaceae bacterium]|jgi:hypothetical protein|nr:carboxypeptidase-like regulatory domain-containing protein [Flammeovirgaceae bacterium]|tara:strand:- start:822 stop:3296 length:2475 start_codon:yes stop_codon:yes gene_type:complete
MWRTFFGLILISFCYSGSAQFIIEGKVTDIETGDPIPFAAVQIKGTMSGNSTNFEGYYHIQSAEITDSIEVSYLGYIGSVKALGQEGTQLINFQLKPSDFELEGFVFNAGENPAFEIIRKTVAQKSEFDKRMLMAYETKNYTKIELDIDQISDGFSDRKSVQKIMTVLDSIKQLTDDEGYKIIPVFFSETVSKFYYRNKPVLVKEIVQKSVVKGVGITDGTTTAQITGSAFQEYNFYENWLTILEKEFVSPIANGWKAFYDYDLLDSVLVGVDSCYLLKVYPLRSQDLAFSGTIWINKKTYALKQVDLIIPKDANLNFVERIKIQQELTPTDAGPLLPSKTRVQIKIGQIIPKSTGFLAKFYTSADSIIVSLPKEPSFFNQAVTLDPNFDAAEESYWIENRQEPLSDEDLAVLQLVDTLRKIPIIRFYSETLKFVANGFLPIGQIDIGSWTGFFNYNNIEGTRYGMGARTNLKFSNKWVFQGYLAYGTRDQKIKYLGAAKLILDRQRWMTLALKAQREIDQVGLEMENLQGNSVFLASTRFGTLRNPYLSTIYQVKIEREFFKGLLLTSSLQYDHFDPLFDFYYLEKDQNEYKSEFQTTEATVGIRYGKDEMIIVNDNDRISFGPSRWPIVEINYTKGIAGLGDFGFDKINFYLYQKLNLSFLGVSRYEIDAGKVFGEVPYPILKNHLGNEKNFYTTVAFNTMNFNEFVSDQYLSLKYRHFFEGFLLNSIPLIRKLKWRAVANANILYGNVSDKNIENSPLLDPKGNSLNRFGRLEPNKPYVEVGYGIENIIKFFRIDFFHRITYLDNDGIKPFAVKISAQIIL